MSLRSPCMEFGKVYLTFIPSVSIKQLFMPGILNEAMNKIDKVPISWSLLWIKSLKKIRKYQVVI